MSDRPDPDPARWARVHERFHEALALPPEEREAFRRALAAADPALAVELGSLLAAHDAASGFLGAQPSLPREHALEPGDRLGPYRIVAEIGHGGMGVVYRATHDGPDFTRDVAIKLIDPGMQSDDILRRFRDERRILALLDHPNIVRLLDGGTAPDGSPYLVMDHVAGTTLLEHCEARALGLDERIDLFLPVCDAVQFAHRQLVVHRDLKSDNILVNESGSPRLLDFGIARLLSPEGTPGSETLTLPLRRILTPEYASPEQVRGEPAAVASDVYSLGVVLYELLTGVRPFRFESRTPEGILRVLTERDPELPSRVVARTKESGPGRGAARRSGRRLAGDLDAIVLRALEKEPQRRYGTVDQLAEDLRRYREGRPVRARRASRLYLASRFVRRHRAPVAFAALAVVALLAGAIGMAWQASVARMERDRANRRFEEVRSLAHAVVFDLHDAIASVPGSTRARELLVQHALEYLDRLRRESGGDLAVQRELGTAYAKIGDVQGRPMFPNLGQSERARESYAKAHALLQAVTAAWPDSTWIARDLVVLMQREADLLGAMGNPDAALALASEAKQRLRAQLARMPGEVVLQRDLGVACDRLFDMRLAAGDTATAMAEMREGLAFTLPLFVANPHDALNRRAILITEAKFAAVHAASGARDSAFACYARAEELAREAVAAAPHDSDALRDLSIVYGMRGRFLAELGQLDSALVVYDRGMQISVALAARDPENALSQADVADGCHEVGSMLEQGGRLAAAERNYAEAFRRYAALASGDTANVAYRDGMARAGRSAGETCEALAARSPGAGRSHWNARAADWYARALAVRRAGRDTADLEAERHLRERLTALRRGS